MLHLALTWPAQVRVDTTTNTTHIMQATELTKHPPPSNTLTDPEPRLPSLALWPEYAVQHPDVSHWNGKKFVKSKNKQTKQEFKISYQIL